MWFLIQALIFPYILLFCLYGIIASEPFFKLLCALIVMVNTVILFLSYDDSIIQKRIVEFVLVFHLIMCFGVLPIVGIFVYAFAIF